MVFSLLPVSIFAADGATATWTKTTLEEITSEDTVAITMTKDGTTWVLPTTGGGNNGQPLAVTGTVGEDTLTTEGYASAFGWTVTKSDESFSIQTKDGKSLYLDKDGKNNCVRIGTTEAAWAVDGDTGYLTAKDTGDTQRYLGVYVDNGGVAQDWRAYTNTTGNIKDQTLGLWKLTSAPEEPEEPTISTIAEALAASSGTFTVKGVVTLVDSKNIYIQDETGGICLYFSAAPSGIALGDTVIGTGTRAAYKGLPELSGASFEKSEGMTLTARETTLGAITDADICTYVTVKDLTVTEISGNNTTVTDQDGNSLPIFKAVTGEALAVGDTIDFTGAVGIYDTMQLRNTVAGEIVKTGSGEEPPAPEVNTIAEALAASSGTFTVKGVVTLVDGKNIYIQDETGGICLYFSAAPSGIALGDTVIGTGTRAAYNGLPELSGASFEKSEGMTLTARETTLGAITDADICTYVTIKNLTVTAISGNNTTVTDQDGNSLPIFKAVADPALAVGDAINFTGAVGIYNTLQLRNTVASEIKPYTEPVVKTGFVTDLADLTDGAKVVILNKANKIALSQVYSPNYNEGVSVTVTDDVLTGYGVTTVWTVGVNDDGTYTFSTADGKKLSMDTQYTSMPLDKVNDAWTVAAVENVEDGFYIDNVGRTDANTGAHYRMEWYADKNYWSAYYKNNDGDLFIQQFYLVDEIPQPTGETYGLTSTLATGDKVILYNANSGMGLGNTMSGYNVAGVALTPADGVITTDNTAVVWDVTVNSDGTCIFTQGDYTLGGSVRVSGDKTYNNLVLTGATYTNWTLTGPDSRDFNYFLSLPEMANSYGTTYLEYFNGFTLYGSNTPDKSAFGITFYKQGAEPETPSGEVGDLITDLDQLDGKTVAIYSPGHKTAISTRVSGDWYLRANTATVENGKVVNFTADFVWKIKKNEDGTFSFFANDDETHSISVWPSEGKDGNFYAELSLHTETYPDNTWTLTSAKTADCFYINSPTVSTDKGPAYIEAYVRNEAEVFSGYFTNTGSYNFTENNFALQFYLVNPDDAVEPFDDGEWDGVLTKGEQYVIYNANAASSLGLFKEANYSLDAIPTTIEGGKAIPGNGAYVFTVDTMGRYYSFEVNGKYLATNEEEELFFADKDENGKLPETAKWFLVAKDGGYIIYNKDAVYNGTPVCIEYYSSVFSGWTYNPKAEDKSIFYFGFYPAAEGTKIREDIVQVPSVVFECEDFRHVEQDYVLSFSLDDLAEEITDLEITYVAGSRTGTVAQAPDGKTYTVTIPAADIDAGEVLESFTITVKVKNSYDIEYEGVKEVEIIDTPFFEDLTPAPNSQTRDDKRPVISVRVGNAGDNPTLTMTVNDKVVEAVFENGVLSYTPTEDMADGRTTVFVKVVRADGAENEKTWAFIVGVAGYQLYFGQLHSHTTYSDGSGSLDTALDYIASLPESANVQFVAFTDHSNYFDTTSAANPADALNDKSLMTEASRALWEEYRGKVAAFNEKQTGTLLAIAGYEMTWSGGPGHINTFGSDGLVSRNNAQLNSKTGDAGMKLYYETINKGSSLNQFNHPGTTFGNFTDFGYWDEATDAHMFLVEVGNGEGQIGAGGYYPSYEQYTLALDKGWHVAPTNNQDNHKGRWGNANDARDVILTNDFSEQGLYDAIRALRLYATEDKNLQVTYNVNGEPMGTIFTGENAPEKLNVEITLYDPDSHDSIEKVELIVNGGITAYTWDDAAELAEGALTAELDPEYSYYYVRVTQKDGDKAVTAPVWVGNALKVGITDIQAAAEPVYKGEEATLVTTLYNNEEQAATIKSLTYTVKGGQVIGTDTTGYDLPAGGTLPVNFKHTFDTAKLTTVTVTAVVEYEGKEYTYTAKVELDVLDRETQNTVSPIADVRAASDPADTGYRFIIEGVVTSNASGYDKDTAFFDCIYVQDDTAGICCFPVSGEYKIGDKVRIVGHTDFYQGEPELQVQTIEIIGTGSVEPTEITAAELNDRSAEGKLVTVKGTVDSFELANGLIQTIMVKDGAGNLARVFIDGYITTAKDVENCAVGAKVVATGLASYDDTFNGPFPRIRIRNRADVICEAYEIPERLWGQSRTATAAAIAEAAFPNGAENVILASGDNYPDALAGGPLAYALDAPILLVCGSNPDEPTLKAIDDLKAKNVYILGGVNAISDGVREMLEAKGLTVTRIADTSRFGTAVKVAEELDELRGTTPTEVFFVYAMNYPDALAVGNVAAIKGAPILYIGADGVLDDDTRAYLDGCKDTLEKIYIIGGPGVIREDAETNLGAYVDKPERVWGHSRFETCIEVNRTFADVLDGDSLCLAYAMNYPDALAGSVFAAKHHAPLLLVDKGTLLDEQVSYVKEKAPKHVYVFGGTGVVPDEVLEQVKAAAQ